LSLVKLNGGAVGGNVQIKGWFYHNKIPFTIGLFFTCLQRKAYQNKVTEMSLIKFSELVDAPGTWL